MNEQGWVAKLLGQPAVANGAPKSGPAERLPASVPVAPAAGGVPPASTDGVAPARPLVVKNWFKLGASAADLEAAQKRCATKLGVAVHPGPESLAVTPEMLDCLRREGWHAF